MKSQKQFFLASFLPAIAYWYLEENYSLEIALTGGVILAVIEMLLEKIFTKKIHTLSKINFFLIAGLGGISFMAREGVWFKLQPFFTGLLMGSFLLFRTFKNNSLMMEMLKDMNPDLTPHPILRTVERNMGFFMLSYGSFMAYCAFKLSTEEWLFYKTIGFYIASAIFFGFHFIYIRINRGKIS